MRGKLIVIEGTDACGKETQSKLLEQYLKNKGIPVLRLSFPNYGTKQAGPVEMYLDGSLGDMSSMHPYAISVLYAVDRFCTIRDMKIQEALDAGTWVICDRYVESNMIYHSSRFLTADSILNFNNDLIELEYHQFKIPTPNYIFYLNLDPDVSDELMKSRGNDSDIHEQNKDFLRKVNKNGLFLANTYGWTIIDCTNHEEKSIQSIAEIASQLLNYIEKTYFNKGE